MASYQSLESEKGIQEKETISDLLETGADVDTTPLDIKDLADVLTELKLIESRFYEIGIMLHLNPDVLDGIESLNPASSSKRMSKMITEWLKRNYDTKRFGLPTWKSLVIAVAERSGGANEACARDIANKHRVPNHSSQVKTSAEEVKSKLFTEDNANLHSTVKEQSFPNLKTENLTEEQREELIAKLTVESEDMRSKFATLVSLMNTSLQDNEISVSKLTVTFKNLDLDEVVKILDDETDMNKAILKASDFWSFFDYEIVKSIINTHCRDDADLQQEVKLYESDFKTYCQRRLCEVPVKSLKTDIPSKTSNLYLKIDETFEIKFFKTKKIEARLSNLLGKCLYLQKVKEGCIELVFSYLGKINLALPLNSQQEEELSEMRVLRLYDDNYEYYPAPTQVRLPLPLSQQSQLPSTNQFPSNTLTTGNSDVPPSAIEMPKLSLSLKSGSYSVKAEPTVYDNYKAHNSQVKASTEEVKPKLLTEDNANLHPTQVQPPSPSSHQSQLHSTNQLSSNILTTVDPDVPPLAIEMPKLSLSLKSGSYSVKAEPTVYDNYKAHNSQVKTSTEEVKPKLFTEDNCKSSYLQKVGCRELVFNINLTLLLNSQQEEELSEMRELKLYDDNYEHYRAPTQVQSPSPLSQQSQLPSTNQLTLTTGNSDVSPSEMPKLLLSLKSGSYFVKAESTVSDHYKGSDSAYGTGPCSITHTESEMVSDLDGRRSHFIAKFMELEYAKVQHNSKN